MIAVPDIRAEMSGDAKERILIAFRDLALESGFDAVSVRDIVLRADVARSTFYENFDNKSDGFRAIATPFLTPLADACVSGADRTPLAAILKHIRETAATTSMTDGASRAILADVLADMTEARLDARRRRSQKPIAAPLSMIAAWIAEAELGVITAWLEAEYPASVEAVVSLIVTGAQTCADAFVGS